MTSLLHLGEGLGAPHMNIDGYALLQEANSLMFDCSVIAPMREWRPSFLTIAMWIRLLGIGTSTLRTPPSPTTPPWAHLRLGI